MLHKIGEIPTVARNMQGEKGKQADYSKNNLANRIEGGGFRDKRLIY